MDSPLFSAARGGRFEGRSPGVATLKEAFDITYAVHRMEEEGARRAVPGGTGNRGFLSGLNEEEDEEEEAGVVEEVSKKYGKETGDALEVERQRRNKVNMAAAPPGSGSRRVAEAALGDGRAGPRDQGRRRHRQGPGPSGFELDLGNATLLGRRHRRVAEPSPLGMNAYAPNQYPREVAPGSPMRID